MADNRKTVLITGCSPGGIGHSLALEFQRQNFRVFATARKTSGINIETFPLEATSESSIQALASEISSRTAGKLDFLVNNAGRNYTVPATDIELSEVRETFETNVFAVMRMCQIFTPMLMAATEGGTIVQIGSLAAILPYVFGSVYNASKAALHAYSETLRVELAPFGVKVVTVVTGGVKSNIARMKRSLPEDSIYLPIRDMYEERLVHSQSNGVPNEEYARRVVDQLLKSPGKDRIWEGGKSWLVWFVYTFLPRWVMGAVMTRMFQLWRLKGTWQKKVN
ncbi:hypothetical protein AC578_1392 [Pseudocercospora eumusae]|uniref:NAD(P)-binding protein n=1 Tax=Pseudocercospora eumusae TaxID=321146 RepID=A0A139HUQ6_9PEZI|nr:hypothetical protein AC578_1392 [Pseudocercospora eumusae]